MPGQKSGRRTETLIRDTLSSKGAGRIIPTGPFFRLINQLTALHHHANAALHRQFVKRRVACRRRHFRRVNLPRIIGVDADNIRLKSRGQRTGAKAQNPCGIERDAIE